MPKSSINSPPAESAPLELNMAFMGGGETCKQFLQYLHETPLPFLQIHIVGVCDANPQADGVVLAKELGIPTTENIEDLLRHRPLDAVVELTGNRNVLAALLANAPETVGIIDHHVGRYLIDYFQLTQQRLQSVEQRIRREQMVLEFLLQLKNEPVVILDTDFKIAQANAAFLDLTRKAKSEVNGRHCYEVIYGYEAHCSSAHPEYACPVIETLRTGKPAHVIHEKTGEAADPSYSNVVSYPIKNRQGEVVQVVEIWQDITREVLSRWEKRTRAIKEDLNKLVQEDRLIALGKLAASCVHEINNPIQGLLTFSRLLEDGLKEASRSAEEREAMHHYATLMTGEIERCGQIVSGLLSFARETPKVYQYVDLKEVMDSVTTLTRHKMRLAEIDMVVEIPESQMLIRGDKNQLQQCFLNLLFNAIDALPKGGRIDISAEIQSDNTVTVELRDNGCGIPQDHIDHIFEPFFSGREDRGGVGLGLSIVFGVVKSHGGDISVESRVDEGTRFRLRFPLFSPSTTHAENGNG